MRFVSCLLAVAATLMAGAWAGAAVRPTPSMLQADTSPLDCVLYFVPDDPYFGNQWHLANPGAPPNVNITGAWASGLTGAGVVIGIVDDCLQTDHPDLAPNYTAAHSWDFGQNDPNPDPVTAEDMHGTSVAGLAAARGGNALGVTGAAPLASLAGLRIDFANQTEQMFADATLYHSSGSDTSIKIKNHSYGFQEPYVDAGTMAGALRTSASAGTIHTIAAGNERWYHENYYFLDANGNGNFDPDVDYAIDADANKQPMCSLSEVIVVAALGADGVYSYYSNWGANVFVTVPSSGIADYSITTTDRTGADGYNGGSDPIQNADYTSMFGGTSAAAPVAAGIMALGKEANPAMDERMAKHLLVRTSRIVNAADATASSDGGWKTNAAGNAFNQNYGFGLIDATAFAAEAAVWTGVTPAASEDTGTVLVNEAIEGEGGVFRNFTFSDTGLLEEVEVNLNIDHTWRGDLEAFLTSPAGTTSRLMIANLADSFDLIDWTFVTNAFWGEQAAGQWRLEIVDTYPSLDDGTWNSFSALARTGELVPEPATMALVALGGVLLARRRR